MSSKNMNPLLTWLWDMMAYNSTDEVVVPTDYHEKVEQVKNVLKSDISGLVNSVLDFSINVGMVDFTVESKYPDLTKTVEQWFKSINKDLRGRIPTGLRPLQKEYYRERWKNSSLIVLRTIWEEVKIGSETYRLPTRMWFVDGANIVIEDGKDTRIIGEEQYYISISDKVKKALPSSANERIYIQRPFNAWSDLYTNPFIIQRGLYKNLRIFELINKKGEKILNRALEYLLLMKKGTEQLALKGDPGFTYSKEDLNAAKESLSTMIANSKSEKGTPTYATNFDTDMSHLIPDYKVIWNKDLYATLEKRILAGLGLIEIVEGITSSRREAILNPIPFIAEVENGINDFQTLIGDVLADIIDKNKDLHKKYMNTDIMLYYPPIKEFINDSVRDHLRSMYDRGVISKQTYGEVVANTQLPIEITRRKEEKPHEKDLYPPVIQNKEESPDALPFETLPQPPEKISKDNVPPDKKGLEKKNYQGEYEEAPYKKIEDLPETVKVLPNDAQDLWLRVFNESYGKGEDYARKVAWTVVKRIYKKDGESWVKKSKAKSTEGTMVNIENASVDDILNDIVNLQKIELQDTQLKLAKKLLGDGDKNETI